MYPGGRSDVWVTSSAVDRRMKSVQVEAVRTRKKAGPLAPLIGRKPLAM